MDIRAGTAQMSGTPDYSASFGAMPHGTYYLKSFGSKVDLRSQLNEITLTGFERKSFMTTTGGAGTAGYATIPVYVDPLIVDVSRKYTPLVELFTRVANQGITADYVRVTAKSFAFTAVENAALADGYATRARVSKSIKYLYSVGLVSGPAQAAVPSYTLLGFQPSGSGLGAGNPFSNVAAPNALDQEVALAARAIKELEENLLINGNSTTSGVTGDPDGTEFDGIIALQSTTNMTNKSGAVVDWKDVEDVVQVAFKAGGRPNLAVASPRVMSRLRQIMIDTFRFNPNSLTTEIAFGIPAHLVLHTTVGPVPVIQSQFMPDTASAGRLYFLDMDFIEVRVLMDMVFERLAKTNDADKFMLKQYETLILRAPEFNAGLYGCA